MKKWFLEDWGMKMIALFLAIGLWYYATGEETIEVNRTIPLEVVVNNENISILKSSTSFVEVTLAAPRALLPEMTSQEIRAVHEIGNEVATAGEYSFRVEPREIKLPSPQIRVTAIEPPVIVVTLDELIVQKLEIKPQFVGEPAFGYQVVEDEIQLNPNAVLLKGPRAQLEEYDAVKTEEIVLVGRTRSFRRTVRLDLPPNVKSLSEELIDAYIPIREEFDEKSYEEVPVRILKREEVHEKIEITPPLISFVVKGPKRRLAELTAEKILAYVDVSDLTLGAHEVPVQFILPEDVALKEETPIVVKVNIKK